MYVGGQEAGALLEVGECVHRRLLDRSPRQFPRRLQVPGHREQVPASERQRRTSRARRQQGRPRTIQVMMRHSHLYYSAPVQVLCDTRCKFAHGSRVRGATGNAGTENAGTSCVWVARRNIISVVGGCVRLVDHVGIYIDTSSDSGSTSLGPLGASRLSAQNNPSLTSSSLVHWTAFMQLYGEESKCHTQTCLHFWAICSVRLLTVKPMLAVSAEQEEAHVHHQRHTNQRHRRLHQLTCLRRRFDDNVYSRLAFLKAVSHVHAAWQRSVAICIAKQRIRTATQLTKQALTPAPRLMPMRRGTTVRCVCSAASRCMVQCGHQRFCEALYSSPGTYWKWLSYLPCGHQHGSMSVLTFCINYFQLAELSGP